MWPVRGAVLLNGSSGLWQHMGDESVGAGHTPTTHIESSRGRRRVPFLRAALLALTLRDANAGRTCNDVPSAGGLSLEHTQPNQSRGRSERRTRVCAGCIASERSRSTRHTADRSACARTCACACVWAGRQVAGRVTYLEVLSNESTSLNGPPNVRIASMRARERMHDGRGATHGAAGRSRAHRGPRIGKE
jgi:hypothetical protein